MLDPVATYDCLFIGSRLQKRFDGFAPAELHLLAYLACLLSVYRKSPVADWGYSFIGTEFGAPYSQEVDKVVRGLIERQLFMEMDDKLIATPECFTEIELFSSLSFYESRNDYLNGACASILAFSVGIVREALSQEPELNRAKTLASTRELLDGPGLQLLYEQFDALSTALGSEFRDLRVPSVAWLTALVQEVIPNT
jgi:hypothetical protein